MSDVSVGSEPLREPVGLSAGTEVLPKHGEIPSVRTKVWKTQEQSKTYTREKCVECSSCKGSNQYLKRNYQGSSEQTPAIKSCSEDRLIEKRRSPSNGRKYLMKPMDDDNDSEFQSHHGQCKTHQIRCYSCGFRKSKQDDECCADMGSKNNCSSKEISEEHYFETRICDQEKSIFTWNNGIPGNQSGRVWIRQSSLLLPYEWEDDSEMIDWLIDQYVQEENNISAYYKGKIILTLKDALGITTVTADSENIPKRFQSHMFETSIPVIPEMLCCKLATADVQPEEENCNGAFPKPQHASSPTPCEMPGEIINIPCETGHCDVSQPASVKQDYPDNEANQCQDKVAKEYQDNDTKKYQGNETKQHQGNETKQCQDSETKQCQENETKQWQENETKQCQDSETKQCQDSETKQYQGNETKQRQGNETKQHQGNETKQCQDGETEQCQDSETKQWQENETKQCQGNETKQCQDSETKHWQENETKQCQRNETKQCQDSETKQCQDSETKQYQGNETKQRQGNETKQRQGNETKQHQGNETKQCQDGETEQCQDSETKQWQENETKQCQDSEIKQCQGNETKQCQENETKQCQDSEIKQCQRNETKQCQDSETKQCQRNETKQCHGGETKQCQENETNQCQGIDTKQCQENVAEDLTTSAFSKKSIREKGTLKSFKYQELADSNTTHMPQFEIGNLS